MLISKNTPKEEILKIDNPNPFNHCLFSSGYVLNEEIKEIADFLGISEEELVNKYLEETERFGRKVHRIKQEKKKINTSEGKVELPHGKCAFYDERFGCLLGDKRPLFCKLSNHPLFSKSLIEWFDLNFIVDPQDPQSLREWMTYLKFHNNDVIPGGELESLAPKEKINSILKFEHLSNAQIEAERLKNIANQILGGDYNVYSNKR